MVREQLCEKEKNYSIGYLLKKLIEAIDQANKANGTGKEIPYYYGNANSMEQLWLFAVMDWKFNKRWDGSEWITKAMPCPRLS
jgi:hypothetical protein